ncbi:MAG: hypothetical protein EON92_14690 [Burkholderiales bacterium]|nr:MAG: hypothetical protein EON92_14690 [Burkholderiales bacterium]
MKPTVVDASAAAAWVLPDESNEAAQALYAQACLEGEAFHAPQLWIWEMGNLLIHARRRERIAPGAVEPALETLAAARVPATASSSPPPLPAASSA